MNLEYSGISDIGKIRKVNQDSYGIYQRDDVGLFVVADGMGGYTNGEKASQMVVAQLSNWWNSFSPALFGYKFDKMLTAIEQVIEYANKIIYTQYNQNEVCGTTVTVLFIYKNLYSVIYAGDSRCYIYEGKKWGQLTVDEIWENQSHISNSERRMKAHPNRGKLVNAIGIKEQAQCRIVTGVISCNAVFILCSDGLYKFCQERFLKDCMKKCKDKRALEKELVYMIDRVYKNGADDNITIVVVRCSEQ